MSETRRGFLKLLGAVAASVGIVKYAEPLLSIPQAGHDWIEDRGDFYIVRVPDFKEFARETLEKPTIFLLGEMAIVRDVRVTSFANVHSPRGGLVHGCIFDSSKAEAENDRPVMKLKGESVRVQYCHFVARQSMLVGEGKTNFAATLEIESGPDRRGN